MKKLMLWMAAFVLLAGGALHAQDITGTWQGTLQAGKPLRLVLKIAKADDGSLKGKFYSIDQGGQLIPTGPITVQAGNVKMDVTAIGGSYEAKLGADGASMKGTWTQGGNPLPLDLAHVTEDNAWPIPEPAKHMAADAKPGFDVVTIKPSVPNRPGKGFGFSGRHFKTVNTNVNDLIAIAYGLHAKQIMNAPPWLGTDLYDIDGVPDVEGQPNQQQMGIMLQKLLADRFAFKFHYEKRELAVYAITVAKSGPKLTKTTAAANDPIGFGFRKLGALNVRNLTMAGFATWMQASVMDRPVVDQTGLTDRYDFTLNWTPDDSQFAQFRGSGVSVPAPSDDPNAPPGLYTAVQEQLGLKLDPVKAQDDVIVIDHVEKPSAN